MKIDIEHGRYLVILIGLLFLFNECFGEITIEKIVTRPPKEKDIGLIFDVTVVNSNNKVKEMLEYSIRSDGSCTINISSRCVVNHMGYVVGGDFGFIEAGSSDTVSLIWPTVSLFNRVGHCPVVIVSSNAKNDEFNLKQLIHFDTRFDALDPDGRIYRARKNFVDCKNWDLDYFANCTPVNCEERYFGLRSYFNKTTASCEAVAKCSDPLMYYDNYVNECIDTRHYVTEEDLHEIQLGKYDNKILNLHQSETKEKVRKEIFFKYI